MFHLCSIKDGGLVFRVYKHSLWWLRRNKSGLPHDNDVLLMDVCTFYHTDLKPDLLYKAQLIHWTSAYESSIISRLFGGTEGRDISEALLFAVCIKIRFVSATRLDSHKSEFMNAE